MLLFIIILAYCIYIFIILCKMRNVLNYDDAMMTKITCSCLCVINSKLFLVKLRSRATVPYFINLTSLTHGDEENRTR